MNSSNNDGSSEAKEPVWLRVCVCVCAWIGSCEWASILEIVCLSLSQPHNYLLHIKRDDQIQYEHSAQTHAHRGRAHRANETDGK